MAANSEMAGDIEGEYGGNRVQPFATPMQVPLKISFNFFS